MLRKLLRLKPGSPDQEAPQAPSSAAVARDYALDVPDAGYVRARHEFYEAFGGPVVERSRYFVICVALSVVVVALVVAIAGMLPLKSIQPWVIKVDDTRGTVVVDKGAAGPVSSYTPGRAVLERELFEFVHQLWSINADYPSMTKEGHAAAYSRTRDRAIQEFRDFIDKEKVYTRVKAEPGLIRSVVRKSVAFRSEQGIAHVRFSTVERTRDNHDGVQREWIMLVQFAQRPQTNEAQLEKNPLGLFITHFEFNEER